MLLCMHIDETTHESGITGKVYRYEADYSIEGTTLNWTGEVRQGDVFSQAVGGSISITFPGAAALADDQSNRQKLTGTWELQSPVENTPATSWAFSEAGSSMVTLS